MRIPLLVPALALALTAAAPASARPTTLFWPPWISIESPVNPMDPTSRDAVFLVHVMTHHGPANVGDVAAHAEGIVGGARRSVPVTLSETGTPGVFAVKRQWPTDGSWIVVLTAFGSTTALVAIDHTGGVAFARVPMQTVDRRLPQTPTAAQIDSTLAAFAATPPQLASH